MRFFKPALFAILLCLPRIVCFAETTGSAVSLDFQIDSGVLSALTREYVYHGEKTESRLEWPENFVPSISVRGELAFRGVLLRAFAVSALSAQTKSGAMEDYDFLIEGSDAVSHYSQHDSYLDKDIELSAALGYAFVRGNWRLSPEAGFSYRSRKWSAVDGWRQYPEDGGAWTGEETREAFSGTVMSYEQSIRFPFTGFEASYDVTNRLNVTLGIKVYPYVWAQTLDSHYLRSKQFLDTMEGGAGGKAQLSASYQFGRTGHFSLAASLSYEALWNLSGKTAAGPIALLGETGNALTTTSGYTAGMDSSAWTFFVGVYRTP